LQERANARKQLHIQRWQNTSLSTYFILSGEWNTIKRKGKIYRIKTEKTKTDFSGNCPVWVRLGGGFHENNFDFKVCFFIIQ
jgi:hypothetical protein